MADSLRPWIGPVVLTAFLTAILGVAISSDTFLLGPVSWLVIVVAAAIIHRLFPSSRFFAISFANFIAVYVCAFVFFVDANFRGVAVEILAVGFVLPIIGFLAGCWLYRAQITRFISVERIRPGHRLLRTFLWFIPVIAIGAATFALPQMGLDRSANAAVLLAAMALIALVIFAVSQNVAAFLVETGLLFESFFEEAARLLVPGFAFVTFYSLNVIIFAAIYRIIDRFTAAPQFLVLNKPMEISFADSLYFSIMTLSTVGYGDVVPGENVIRILAAIQVVTGVLLLLFGFNEILRYSRAHSRRP